ncbi:hypothetical protein EYZ11_000035 [Aspergillus tanneri]|uniref:Uncharacterized protein n=1 Tax=Aspergillus tanneri TaxID=1220188 RepID=A0A4V3UQV3_9EURO|nr:hypothetical protein EYZ11_000035 [Aspergillus tanneri]
MPAPLPNPPRQRQRQRQRYQQVDRLDTVGDAASSLAASIWLPLEYRMQVKRAERIQPLALLGYQLRGPVSVQWAQEGDDMPIDAQRRFPVWT